MISGGAQRARWRNMKKPRPERRLLTTMTLAFSLSVSFQSWRPSMAKRCQQINVFLRGVYSYGRAVRSVGFPSCTMNGNSGSWLGQKNCWHAVACCGKSTANKNRWFVPQQMPRILTRDTEVCLVGGALQREGNCVHCVDCVALCDSTTQMCCWPASFLDAMGHGTWPFTRKWTEHSRIARMLSTFQFNKTGNAATLLRR